MIRGTSISIILTTFSLTASCLLVQFIYRRTVARPTLSLGGARQGCGLDAGLLHLDGVRAVVDFAGNVLETSDFLPKNNE